MKALVDLKTMSNDLSYVIGVDAEVTYFDSLVDDYIELFLVVFGFKEPDDEGSPNFYKAFDMLSELSVEDNFDALYKKLLQIKNSWILAQEENNTVSKE